MNISKLHLLRNMAALLLCASAASCSQDDLATGQGEPLTPGMYPLELMTSSIDETQSRAAGKDEWTYDGTEYIGVRIGADGNISKYVIGAGGSAQPVSIDQTIYWQSTASATIKAWYPYAYGNQTYDISDQSKGYAAFDLLYAETEGSYAAPVNLAFSHRMAKVSYTLVKGEGITDADLAAATVTLLGDKSVTVSGGKITAAPKSHTDEIKPCPDAAAHTGSAVMVPQDMTGKPLIKVTLSGNDFIYTPVTDEAGNLQAGCQHSYTITVKANGIEVTAATGGSWNDNGSEDVGITITYDGTETEAKTGDYYYADGTWSDGGLRKLYADGTMEWAETTPQPVSGKTCIGIVFYTGQHETDQSNYASTGIGQEKCHGYAVALTDATSGYCMWGVYGTELECYPTDGGGNKLNNSRNPDIDWSGYAWTQKIITAAGGKGNLNASDEAGYPATWYAVVSYETGCNAPTNSSGWFLPSIGQMWNIYHNRSSLFNGKAVVKSLKSDWYWSSSELYNYPASIALYVSVNDGGVGSGNKRGRYSYVRPVLAF